MTVVKVRDNEPFEVAMRRFKRSVERTGLLTELRSREYYEKPTAERKRKRAAAIDRKSTRLNSSHVAISYAVFCLKKKSMSHVNATDLLNPVLIDAWPSYI